MAGTENNKMLKSKHIDVNLKFALNKDVSHCVSSTSFWVPDLINLSAWIEHAPFAFWLVEATNPGTIVELGTHQGYSYFVFCQAVKQLGLSTRCYAIDTWEGDEHSGFYDEVIFQNVNIHNTQQYSGFSQLMRSTFDDALAYFTDGSIDILHIDGRHFYKDVKHDFEAWLPKLSDRAIVLLHDINVKERHFGVFKLWEELRCLYPHFEFIHDNGLGVLAVGKSIAPESRALFDITNNDKQVANIRSIYSRLGAGLTDRYHSIKLIQEEASLRDETFRLRDDKFQNEEEKKKLKADLENARQALQQLKIQLTLMEGALKERSATITNLNSVFFEIYSSPFWRWLPPLKKLRKIFLLRP